MRGHCYGTAFPFPVILMPLSSVCQIASQIPHFHPFPLLQLILGSFFFLYPSCGVPFPSLDPGESVAGKREGKDSDLSLALLSLRFPILLTMTLISHSGGRSDQANQCMDVYLSLPACVCICVQEVAIIARLSMEHAISR